MLLSPENVFPIPRQNLLDSNTITFWNNIYFDVLQGKRDMLYLCVETESKENMAKGSYIATGSTSTFSFYLLVPLFWEIAEPPIQNPSSHLCYFSLSSFNSQPPKSVDSVVFAWHMISSTSCPHSGFIEFESSWRPATTLRRGIKLTPTLPLSPSPWKSDHDTLLFVEYISKLAFILSFCINLNAYS